MMTTKRSLLLLSLALLCVASWRIAVRWTADTGVTELAAAPSSESTVIDPVAPRLRSRAPAVVPGPEPVGVPADALIVRCQGPSGVPAAAATVRLERSSGPEERVTDARGEARFSPASEGPFEVLAFDARGNVGHAWAQSEVGVVDIRLAPSTSIRGRVSRHDGGPLDREIQVVAAAKHDYYATDGLDLLDRPSVVVALCARDGTFELSGLRPDVEYFVSAGGGGLVSDPEYVEAIAGRDEATLTLSHLYGARARFVASGRSESELRAAVTQGQLTLLRPAGLRKGAPDLVPMQLAHFPPTSHLAEPSAHTVAFALISESPFDESTPLELSVAAAGYWPQTVPLMLTHLSSGLGAPTTIPLAERNDVGALRIVDPSGRVLMPEGQHRWCQLLLRESQATARIPVPENGVALVEGLPTGKHSVRILRSPGLGRYPIDGGWLPIEIGPDPFTLVLDGADFGDLEIEVVDAEGRPYAGGVALQFSPNEPTREERTVDGVTGIVQVTKGVGHLYFDRAPYVAPGLAAGTWYVTLVQPSRSVGYEPVTIRPGRGAKLHLSLPLSTDDRTASRSEGELVVVGR